MLILLAALQSLSGAPDSTPEPPRAVFHGRRGEVSARAPRVEDARVAIDGRLDEPVWSRATLLTGFSLYDPVDGRPSDDSTEILVWHAPHAIYFGIRAFAPPGTVNATLAERDKIESDDNIQLLIDTYNDHRQALVFAVNPLGVQADGIRSESHVQAPSGPGGASARASSINDLTPDFVFESKGRLTEDGYEVEVRIPFKSIRYQDANEQTWGLNVLRKTQRTGYEESWTPARRASASFLAQSGMLVGLTQLRRGLVLDLTPETTGKLAGAPPVPAGQPGWAYADPDPEMGVNVRWGITNNLTLDGTVNPDFSQVEADVGQITSNQRFALFVAERRPFFLQGIERFETPNRLIYTRRIFDPVAGTKLTGKLSATNLAVLSAVDDRRASANGSDYPVFNLLRLRRDLGRSSTLGLVYTDRIEGSSYDRMAAADARIVFGRIYTLSFQGAGDFARTAAASSRAPLWEASFDRAGRQLLLTYRVTGIHSAFNPAAAFISRPGVVNTNVQNRLRFYGGRGAFLETWTTGVSFNGWWEYGGFWNGELPLETKAFLNNAFALKGGWDVTLNFGWETYAFDPSRYITYGVMQGGTVVPFNAPARINDVHGIIARLSTPEFATFSASLGVNRWDDVGFAEAVGVHLLRMSADVLWRPTGKLRVNFTYGRLQLDRRYDGSRLSTQDIPRLKVEYQISRPIFVRFVGQYNADRQNPLRDPRNGGPIFLLNSSGTYVPSATRVANDIRVDWLFSYRPNPGTVLFAGYGSSLTEVDSFSFRDLRRTSDGFFVKMSYLVRF
ncbi:MAG: carbohydrate binding family 9 domain-containing protein [Gemmatimonadetes bacterium]|nr:carbohydrate binding family 9 domain-containing protein [Gemmatimonadota bacterium]